MAWIASGSAAGWGRPAVAGFSPDETLVRGPRRDAAAAVASWHGGLPHVGDDEAATRIGPCRPAEIDIMVAPAPPGPGPGPGPGAGRGAMAGAGGHLGVSRRPAPGRRLGPYRLIERLGRGRQADVWRAVRVDADHGGVPGRSHVRDVAIKLLPAVDPAGDPRRPAQLRHEAERGVRFADPSLLPTCDFGEDDGLLFLAMPLVVGCTLGDVLAHRRAFLEGQAVPAAAHRLSLAAEPRYAGTAAALLARVARAVHAAHGARVVHRDIKPMNILVRYDLEPFATATAPGPSPAAGRGLPEAPPVFLCDFGLARDLDVATPRQLRDGAGSPLYMAPERLLRRPADEVRCDVYALGVTLYEALTLAPPVEVPPELPSRHWAEFLAWATPRPLRAARPGLGPRLEAVVHRAIDRDPARRHPTAAAFADDLETALALGSPLLCEA